DEPTLRRALALELAGHALHIATSCLEALDLILAHPIDAVVSDLRLGPGPGGLHVLAQARALRPQARRLLVPATLNDRGIDEAIADGRIDHLVEKPWRRGELAALLA